MRFTSSVRRQPLFGMLVLFGLCLALVSSHCLNGSAQAAMEVERVVQPSTNTAQLSQQARDRFAIGDFEAAAELWQVAAQQYAEAGDWLAQARTLSNLSLAYQNLAQWPQARVRIEESLDLLARSSDTSDGERLPVLAQALNSQGNLLLSVGEVSQAIASWEQASKTYQQSGNTVGYWQSQMNLAQALQTDGFYLRALDVLSDVVDEMADEAEGDERLKASALRRLGDVQRATGELEGAAQSLEKSLEIAQRLRMPEEVGATLLGIANTERTRGEMAAAIAHYTQAAEKADVQTRLSSQLALLNLLLEDEQTAEQVQSLWPAIQNQIEQLPANRTAIYHRINWVANLARLKRGEAVLQPERVRLPEWDVLAESLATAIAQAQEIGDARAESYGLGYLGGIYEQSQQWQSAKALTAQALLKAEQKDARDVAYRWQWQNARLLKAQGDVKGAISNYSDAIQTLQTLRNDLVAIHADIQFSFRKDVEPIYRELVGLLLQSAEPSAENLSLARNTIEALQIAELDDYFKEACTEVTTPFVELDQVDPEAAILYPIILPDRLEMIVSYPGGKLQHYATPVSEADLTQAAQRLRQTLVIRSRSTYLSTAKQLYDWLIRPEAADLRASGVKTLTFVPDGPLKNVPMAVLNDGDRYLIEDYRIALTPGLTLSDPKPLPNPSFSILAAGLTEGRSGFSPLDNVKQEIGNIADFSPKNVVLLDESFTQENLQENVQARQTPVVHIATHGQFGAQPESTFLVAWDELIEVSELDNILKARLLNQETAIELLVLSACQTAAGDERAALGLAGMAVKSGARSTLATLWSVNDAATTDFMTRFYETLSKPGTTRAEALQQAQLSFITDTGYNHPFFWAPFVLLGSWL